MRACRILPDEFRRSSTCFSPPGSAATDIRASAAYRFPFGGASSSCAVHATYNCGPPRRTPAALLRPAALLLGDRLVIVRRVEFGAVAAPGAVLDGAVDLAQPRRRQPQRHHLPDPHHDIPGHNLDAGG